ncbi:hypothetical protein HLB44_27290 [Aquincola sp. S2]|uniref:DUF4123 domain-containing protein n=1 Tax=Pseudaquabacterium terrae TaxID=2732868 RepID=A0ABX2EPZ9_9BURK|nr:hypothetical protein [Aquabacterium terrae]NRF70716.1 hypothetical protein [Aquabacterium terrae]
MTMASLVSPRPVPSEAAASRLRSEFARLYLPPATPQPGQPPAAADLVDAQGCTRALVLELGSPAEWAPLRAVWQGVQSELGQPAPAIAVCGAGLQLWFSAPAPVCARTGRRFLEALCARYLPTVARHRLRLYPTIDATTPEQQQPQHAPCIPAPLPGATTWSAFVTPDLVPVFEDTPWLDSAPSDEGQAALLERLSVMTAGSLESLGDAPADEAVGAAVLPPDPVLRPIADALATAQQGRQSARAFLLRVINDETAVLAVRVEAARILLHEPHEPHERDQQRNACAGTG